jgi:hypothetical protein
MLNLSGLVRQLAKQRDRAETEAKRLNAALKVLGGWASAGKKSRPRRMSAKSRARIGAAQRARWARVKAAAKKH